MNVLPQTSTWVQRLRRSLHDSNTAIAEVAAVAVSFGLLYFHTLHYLVSEIWSKDDHSHGPIVAGLAAWLIARSWRKPCTLPRPTQAHLLGWVALCLGLLIYTVGKAFGVLLLEVGSLVPVIGATIFIVAGPQRLRHCLFGIAFLLFLVPLPSALVETLTLPMKMAVSVVSEWVLHGLGYPMGRSGVVLQIGPYALLVADACAGLNTLFTLEALGLLYVNVVHVGSGLRNALVTLAGVPISFFANVARVCLLSVITYHFGDEAGQGFLHSFAGLFMFMVALLLLIGADTLIRRFALSRKAAGATQ